LKNRLPELANLGTNQRAIISPYSLQGILFTLELWGGSKVTVKTLADMGCVKWLERFDRVGFERIKRKMEQKADLHLTIVRKVEKFFSNFITCQGRKNAFCDSHINLCLPCVKLRLIMREGKLPSRFGVNTKFGTYYFVCLNKIFALKTLSYLTHRNCSLQFSSINNSYFVDYAAQQRWRKVEEQVGAILAMAPEQIDSYLNNLKVTGKEN